MVVVIGKTEDVILYEHLKKSRAAPRARGTLILSNEPIALGDWLDLD